MILRLLISASVKAALLLGVAWLITLLTRRGSAAIRHQVWALAVFGVLTLPVLQLALPAWHASATVPGSQLWRAAVSSQLIDSAPSTTSVNAIPASPPEVHWTSWIIGIWLVGAGFLLSRLAYGLAGLSQGGATPPEELLLQTVDRCSRKVGIDRSVVPLLSPEIRAMPCTWGVAHPRILLPQEALEWPPVRLEMVLTHELAHIQRLDWPVRLMAEMARAFFWFHPLVWLAASRLRDESERACDDAVLASGEDAARYASELLNLIRHARKSPAAALAVARHSHFEKRFTSMLDPTRNRRRLTAKAALFSTAAALLCLLPLASLRAPAAESAAQFSGSVVDSSGAAVPNATVIMTNIKTHESKMTGTDATGAYEFDALPPGNYERQVTREGFSDLVFSQMVNATNSPAPVTVMSKGEPAKGVSSTLHHRIGGGVAAANLVHQAPPTYPPAAKAAGIDGTVSLTTLIDGEGGVLSARVQNTDVNPALGRAAIEAVGQWRYNPTLLNGNAIEVETIVKVNFTLSQ